MQIKVQGELFHTHPHLEREFGLDKDHVIVDKAAFIAVIREIQELRENLLRGIPNLKED